MVGKGEEGEAGRIVGVEGHSLGGTQEAERSVRKEMYGGYLTYGMHTHTHTHSIGIC